MKYICNVCDDICENPCILEVEDGTAIPTECPYAETKYPEWIILKERNK